MFKCPRCTLEFHAKSSLVDHLRNHPTPNTKPNEGYATNNEVQTIAEILSEVTDDDF